MPQTTVKIESTQQNAGEQIDTTLDLIRARCHDGKYTWSAEAVKEECGGTALFQIQFERKPEPE